NVTDVAKHPKYVFERVDLRDKKEVLRVVREHCITHVLHLAAESHVDRSIAGPDAFIHTNVVGTFHLLETCRAFWKESADGARFVHVSTDEVYGSLGEQGAFTETSPYTPSSPYSASKAAADMLVRAYDRTYGMPVVITNCANNYGPFQFPEKLIPVAIHCILSRRAVPVYGDGQQVRDWLHVRDHAEALWLALIRGRDGETYNIGARNEWTNLRIVERLCDLVDELAPQLGGNSRKLISFVADRPGHDRRYAIDPSKIERELGWKPARDFDAGLHETVRWYLDHEDWLRRASARH
ncbi:MAG: dTDP-glucose 4,6-dehydratase, partial [Verrucomicrobia bacterium]|nr:dTDP-glucose 4,6-dehydratase [Verrucomicrobiota bacterium]